MEKTTALYLLIWIVSLLPTGKAEASQGREQFTALMRLAMSTNQLADWDTLVNYATLRCDTPQISLARLNRLLCLSNNYPADSVIAQGPSTLSFLLQAKQYNLYFNAYNTYINGFFSNRQYKEAQQQASNMFEIAQRIDQPAGMAMSLMVQGSMFYKLNLYDKALTAIEEGLRLCPTYKERNNQTMFIYGYLCTWGFMTAEKIGKTDIMEKYATFFNELVDWREANDIKDPTGHYPVTARSLRANVLLKEGKTDEADTLLKEAERFIRPQIPANAYEHFYGTRTKLYHARGEYTKALADIDLLIEAHKEFPSFYLDDLLRKAELLSLAGQPQKGVALYHEYIQAKDSVNRVEIATRLEELQTLYEVNRLRLEQHNSRLWLLTTTGGCFLLLCLLTGYILYSHRLRTKNRALYQRIRQQEHRDDLMVETIRQLPEQDLSAEMQLFMKLNELLEKEKIYTNPSLTREELARRLGTNHTYLMEAVRACTENLSIREYLNQIRLRCASQLLTRIPRLPVDHIWQDSGFASRSVFYEAFRSKYGMSPSEYRNLSKEEQKRHA